MKQNRKAQDLFETNYKSDWRYFPTFETQVKLSLVEKKMQSSNKSLKDESNKLDTEMSFNILHMVVILQKNHILKLLLNSRHSIYQDFKLLATFAYFAKLLKAR